MPSYNYLVERLYELTQVSVALSALGIVACIALYLLWGRYEEALSFIKDDGLQGRFAEHRLRRLAASRLKRGECPIHGGNLKMYGGKCPFKDCQTGKEE